MKHDENKATFQLGKARRAPRSLSSIPFTQLKEPMRRLTSSFTISSSSSADKKIIVVVSGSSE
jgi:hypothetical protein